MTISYFKVDASCIDLYERRPEDQYGDRSTVCGWAIDGVDLSKENDYGCLPVRFDIKEGEIYYLVYAVYSTGDSFGTYQDSSIELIEVFKDKKVAGNAIKDIVNYTKDPRGELHEIGSNICWIKLDNGYSIKINIPWLGYFESLSYIEIYPFYIGHYNSN